MKQMIRNWLIATAVVASFSAVLVPVVPQTSYAAATTPGGGSSGGTACPNEYLLTFPAWFRGLVNDKCEIVRPGAGTDGLSHFIWKIVLNIVEFALQLVGYIAVAYIIWAGFKYIYSAGDPSGMVSARKMIMNAVIGLVLSIFSVAIVRVIAGSI